MLKADAPIEICSINSATFVLTIETMTPQRLVDNTYFTFTSQADKFKMHDLIPLFPRVPEALKPINDTGNLPKAKKLKLSTVETTLKNLKRSCMRHARSSKPTTKTSRHGNRT